MCRATVAPAAVNALAALLARMAVVLAEQAGVARELVTIGPVDFGPGEERT